MARRPRVETSDDGSAAVRLQIPPATWGLVQRYASKLALRDEDALRVFLQQIDALIATGDMGWLSADWKAVAAAVSAQPRFQGDLSKLHRSDRVKSGFFGVYVNGKGFRAIGRRGEAIATCASAEEAAFKRYQHYVQHGFPYGELEVEVNRLRRSGESGTDGELRRIALETAKLTQTLHLYVDHMTPEERMIFGSAPEAGQMAGFAPGQYESAAAALRAREEDER